MKFLSAAALAMAACALQASGVRAEPAKDKIVIADVGASAVHWPAYIAEAQGFFANARIALDFVKTASSAAGLQAVAAGSADLASAGFPDSLRAIDKGAPIRILRVEEGPAPYEVYARRGIANFAALKGKTVIVGGPQDITRTYFERMAVPEGLPSGSYDLVYAGSAAGRLSGLVSGSVDAAILNPPFNFKAADAGFTDLRAPSDYSAGLPFTSYAVNAPWAAAHRDLVARFLSAYARGVDWFYDAANKQRAIALLLARLPVTQREAQETYHYFVSHRLFDRAGAVGEGTVEGWLKVLKAQGQLDNPVNAPKFWSMKD